jgi:hypothetical protein
MELKISESTAKRLYPESPSWFREVLEETFSKQKLVGRKFDEIRTFEDACEQIGVNPLSVFSDIDTYDEIAYKKLKIIAKAINQGWTPDWSNTNQKKWWPWFDLSSGFGFSNSGYYYTYSFAAVGSRLCFESEAKSDYCAKQFISLYQELLTIKK